MAFEHFDAESDNDKANEELLDDPAANHQNDLFDTKEDVYGERHDLATGKPIDNTKTNVIGISQRQIGETDNSSDVMGTVADDDETDRWLRENDYNMKKPSDLRDAA